MNKFYDSGKRLVDPEELDLLSAVMYLENGNNSDYVMQLTGSVVLNRVAHKNFPNTIKEVLYQKGQYATAPRLAGCVAPDYVRYMAKMLLLGGSIAPADVVFQSMYKHLGSSIFYTENGEYFARY